MNTFGVNDNDYRLLSICTHKYIVIYIFNLIKLK